MENRDRIFILVFKIIEKQLNAKNIDIKEF